MHNLELNSPEVQNAAKRLQTMWPDQFSNQIIAGEGYRWVDLVVIVVLETVEERL